MEYACASGKAIKKYNNNLEEIEIDFKDVFDGRSSTYPAGEEENVHDDIRSPIPTPGRPIQTAHSSDEASSKYLVYLTHSGFHNQRISFENALFLGYVLNRTVLVPPILLGHPTPWHPFRYLANSLMEREKELQGIYQDCKDHWSEKAPLTINGRLSETDTGNADGDRDCTNVTSLSVSWNHLFNFSKNDTIVLNDNIRGSYQFHELDPENNTSIFKEHIQLSDLAAIESPVLVFGSLFGTHRVVTSPNNKLFSQVRSDIENSTIFRRKDIISNIAQKIVGDLGGTNSFFGLHIRSGDGAFAQRVNSTVSTQVALIKRYIQFVNTFPRSVDDISIRNPHIKQPFESSTTITETNPHSKERLKICLIRSKDRFRGIGSGKLSEENILIYLATDAKSPEADDDFRLLFETFPCVFSLSTFWDYLDPIIHPTRESFPPSNTSPLQSEFFSSNPPIFPPQIYKFLIPMLDQLVPSNAAGFIGTEGSTFSKYILRIYSERICGNVTWSISAPGKIMKGINQWTEVSMDQLVDKKERCGWSLWV
ncbi:hypothetical protein BKA69DRAFT_1024206 [Paraphysoderma sedebokerense]|nr:hypothetical protein BKA69DRAFT_1024206 [Paraphysoderma sedebokerense]